jgi:hypothetical protein
LTTFASLAAESAPLADAGMRPQGVCGASGGISSGVFSGGSPRLWASASACCSLAAALPARRRAFSAACSGLGHQTRRLGGFPLRLDKPSTAVFHPILGSGQLGRPPLFGRGVQVDIPRGGHHDRGGTKGQKLIQRQVPGRSNPVGAETERDEQKRRLRQNLARRGPFGAGQNDGDGLDAIIVQQAGQSLFRVRRSGGVGPVRCQDPNGSVFPVGMARHEVGQQQHQASGGIVAPPYGDMPRPLLAPQGGLPLVRIARKDGDMPFLTKGHAQMPPELQGLKPLGLGLVRVQPVDQHQIGLERADAGRLHDGVDAGLNLIDHEHLGKDSEPPGRDVALQFFLRLPAQAPRLGPVPLKHAHDNRHPTAAFHPAGQRQQPPAPLGLVGKRQNLGPPVAVVVRFRRGGQQVGAHLLQVIAATAVGPAGRTGRTRHVLQHGKQNRNRHDAGHPVHAQHHHQAGNGAKQAQLGMEPAETGPERRAGGPRLEIGGVVQQPVGDQKKHGYHGRNQVEVAQGYRGIGDGGRQEHGAPWVALRTGALGEGPQEAEEAVGRQRLQNAWPAQKRRHG